MDNPDTDLKTLLLASPDSQSQVYTSALQVLEGLKTSPSCHRLAAASLIRSCQSIDGSSPDPEESLEDVKSVYAAQRALCEIMDAGSKSPEDCRVFVPSHSAQSSRKVTRSFTHAGSTTSKIKGKLGLCLQALESRPQHWTSYSNNRQNAIVMCQAARIDIEKDNLIRLHESLINTTSDASSALTQAVAAVNKALLEQKQFATEVEQFQQQLTHDLELSKAQTQSYLRNFMNNVESAMHGTIKPFLEKMRKVETKADEVHNKLQSSAAKANELRSNIDNLVQQAADDRVELAMAHAKILEAILSAKDVLSNDLQTMGEVQVQSLVGVFDNINSQLRVSNEIAGVMYARQTELNSQLLDLDKHLASLKASSTALYETQLAEANAQLILSNQVQIDLQVAQGLVANITTSAASLQASLQETGSRVADIVALGGLGGLTKTVSLLAWWLVLLFVLYQFNSKYARYVATALGKIPDTASLD
ncbi:MAG: hypothetical protein LQ337_007025 [Flavoplaca oasis]|nr:MAG: hypothetical protein LQ337_007025 [Flavoplaca oasis]